MVATLVSCVLLYVLARRIDIQAAVRGRCGNYLRRQPAGYLVPPDGLAGQPGHGLVAGRPGAGRISATELGAAIGSGTCFAGVLEQRDHTGAVARHALAAVATYGSVNPVGQHKQLLRRSVQRRGFYPLLAILKGELLPGQGTTASGESKSSISC